MPAQQNAGSSFNKPIITRFRKALLTATALSLFCNGYPAFAQSVMANEPAAGAVADARASVKSPAQTLASSSNGKQQATSDATELEPIVIIGTRGYAAGGSGYKGADDALYATPASSTMVSRQAIESKNPRNSYDLFADVAGVSVAGTAQNPGVAINVRGLQDQSRVTTTIDGARQNYQQAGHGYSSNVYIDPALISAIDIDKNMGTGIGSGGSHGGVVAFRSLTVDDILLPGKNTGGWVDGTLGTNAYEFNGNIALGARTDDHLDIVAAISRKKLGTYDIGRNGELKNSPDFEQSVFTGSDTTSGLLKAGINLENDQRVEWSFIGYDADFTTSVVTGDNQNTNHVRNLSSTLTYTWSPEDPLFDLKSQIWWNQTSNNQVRSARNSNGPFDIDYGMNTYGFNLENTSKFALANGEISFNYGTELFLDRTSTDVDGESDDDDWWYSGPNPSGQRWLSSTFGSVKYQHQDWLEASLGGRYDYYKINGQSTIKGTDEGYYTEGGRCRLFWPKNHRLAGQCRLYFPGEQPHWVERKVRHNVEVDQSEGRFSPEAMIAIKPYDGVQVFAKYNESFRPGTISEMLMGGQHIGGLGMHNAPNPNLTPETSKSWEIGANLKYDDLFTTGDALRVKAAYFDRRIDDYIVLGASYGSPVPTDPNQSYYTYTNLLGESRLKGVEVEANYDAGAYYLGGSFTYTNGEFPNAYNSNPWGNAEREMGDAGAILHIAVAPKYRFSSDFGMRFLDDRLNIGARANHVVPSDQIGMFSFTYQAESYTTVDLYGSWQFNPNASLRFAINNITDKAYVDALNSSDFPAAGRTATVSLKLRF